MDSNLPKTWLGPSLQSDDFLGIQVEAKTYIEAASIHREAPWDQGDC